MFDDFFGSAAYLLVMLFLLLLLSVVLPPLLAYRKGYSWYLWTIACGLLGLIVLAFLPYANKPDEDPEVNRTRRQTGNIVGAVLSGLGLLSCFSWMMLVLLRISMSRSRSPF